MLRIIMSNCEICGKKLNNLSRAIIEGVMVDVCGDCSKYGKVISIRKPLMEPERIIPVKIKEISEDVVSNYSELIKKAREKKGLKQDDLAKNIAEKESTIHKIETGALKPSFNLARKLEQFLGIKLIGISEEKREINLNLKDNSLTIGDLIKIRR